MRRKSVAKVTSETWKENSVITVIKNILSINKKCIKTPITDCVSEGSID